MGEPSELIFALPVVIPKGKLLLSEKTESAGVTAEKVTFGEIGTVALGTWLIGKNPEIGRFRIEVVNGMLEL